MEKDTVLLSLETYNELRDFKKEVEENRNSAKFAVIGQRNLFFGSETTTKYYTESEAVLDFENRNNELEAENNELKAENNELKAENNELRSEIEKSKSDLKKMSYWKFRKLRKS